MKMLIIHGAVLVAFAVLFVRSGGFFDRAACFINRKFLAPLMLCDETVKFALLIVFGANILGAAALVSEWAGSTVRDGYLVREDYGGSSYSTRLNAEIGGEVRNVELEIPARTRTDEEIEDLLTAAAARLPDLVLDGMSASHVDRNLDFVDIVGDEGIRVSWMTSDPSVIDWDGNIGGEVHEAGADVQLSASLILDEHVKDIVMDITVYPRVLSDSEKFSELVNSAVDEANEGREGNTRLVLPSAINGRAARWSLPASATGVTILFIGILAAVLYIFSRVQNRSLVTDKKRQQLRLDYPHVISRMVLYLNAGMSMRMTFARIAADYRCELARGGERREGYEVIAGAALEMEKGVSEADAYIHIGQNTLEVRYKTFSTLLVMNLRKGSRELVGILEKESAEAFEERKKQARILGEEAGTKLMFPMLLMLGVVLVILMVPAYLSFQG